MATALLAVAVFMVAAVAWLAGTTSARAAGVGAAPGAAYASLTRVVVQPGQSLWSIAMRAEPAADPRSVIQEIIGRNGLRGITVQPGERLWVPRG